jgi:hypothetical protein
MNVLVFFVLVGLVDEEAVKLIRSTFDKKQRVPTMYWLLLAWGLGIGAAYLICGNLDAFQWVQGIPESSANCVGQILTGLGLAGVAAFWHEVLSVLSALRTRLNPPAASTAPKGLTKS